MRIIGGTARGRKLADLKNVYFKPTSDMVKESVFNIVQFDIEGRRVLDLFAGSGQLGLETISRGAKSVVFVDTDPDAVRIIHKNIKICDFSDKATVHRRDALRYIENCESFDLIFLDPPFDSTLATTALEKIIEFDKLNTNGIIICETKADTQLPATPPPYLLQKTYIYGNVKISRITRE
ncbi:MAG: 16S rRNA (guanine(966)-N(2))-methyltransferase RsmD [Oscillospiraceae bacterium]|nr:16S rRNA (guanine(966)-N(2))-methyltransferase RsmD [Oscillospiraceae bacterium]